MTSGAQACTSPVGRVKSACMPGAGVAAPEEGIHQQGINEDTCPAAAPGRVHTAPACDCTLPARNCGTPGTPLEATTQPSIPCNPQQLQGQAVDQYV
jgi:hypothetical protein